MKVVKKIADNFEGYCCAVMLAVMSVVVFLQVIFRFVIKASLPWSEELSRYLLVYITYFGCAYGIKTGAHLGVEAFVLILPKTVQKAINVLVQIGGLVVCEFKNILGNVQKAGFGDKANDYISAYGHYGIAGNER